MSSNCFGRFGRMLFLCVVGLAIGSCAAAPETRQISTENAAILEAYANWAALLREANEDAKAAGVETQATKLEQAFRRPLSTYIGFDPSEDLIRYAKNLRAAGRNEDANKIDALAKSYRDTQFRNLRSHGGAMLDLYRYYAPK